MERDVMRWAARSAIVVAVAGAVAVVSAALSLVDAGPAFGPLADAGRLLATLALAPIVAAFYELGGLTPPAPARVARAVGIVAILAWAASQGLVIVGTLTPLDDRPASGAAAVQAIALVAVGLWIAGADLLAGDWLPSRIRFGGVVVGVATVAFGLGLLVGGPYHPLTIFGAVPSMLLLPAWAWRLAGVFRTRAART